VQYGEIVYLAGQDPLKDGKLQYVGKLGADFSLEEGYEAARLCALNLLAILQDYLGDLARVRRILKVVGYVNSAPGFSEQPAVVNGASDLLVQVFGDNGKHARTAIGVNELPGNIAVEVDLIAAVE
jgi:enamine deaminase RidA (YjgF/YER057c/UK114 family)